MQTRNLTLADLKALQTLSVGQSDDLKIEDRETRVWLSRMTVEDGQPYDNMVTIEKYHKAMYRNKGEKAVSGGRWETVYTYQALDKR